MSLYSTTKGTVADDMLFSIADQIKHGIANLAAGDDPDLRIDIAKLYELAGVRAVACADHAASRSYLNYALFLLPTDHWKSHYDLSIQISLRLAKSCYSCGDVEKAQYVVQEIIGQCHSFEEKIPAHALLAKSEYNPCILFTWSFT
jgi:predicted ATPase